MTDKYNEFIRQAIALARSAKESGNDPFGALLVCNGKVLLRAENTARTDHNPTCHAEMNLIKEAWASIPQELIEKSTLYTSSEPCPMCAGAIYLSKIKRLVFSFPGQELGIMMNTSFARSCADTFSQSSHLVEIIGPILCDEGREVHEGFWEQHPGIYLRSANS